MLLFMTFILGCVAFALLTLHLILTVRGRLLYGDAVNFPGPKPFPIIGSGHLFLGDTESIYKNGYEYIFSFPSPSRNWLGHHLFIAVHDPDQLKAVFSSPKSLEKADLFRIVWPWLGQGLFAAPFEKWKVHRRLISPAFNTKILESFVHIFEKHANKLVEKWKSEVGGGEFDVLKYTTANSFGVVCESLMGINVSSEDEKYRRFGELVGRLFESVNKRSAKLWMHPEILFRLTKLGRDTFRHIKYLHSVTENVIREKKEELKSRKNTANSGNRWRPFLELLMELTNNGKKFTDKELREEVDTMLAAGSDTTAVANSFNILMLASEPEIQEKAYEELYDIYGDSSTVDNPVQIEDLSKMEYLERVIKESLRLFSVGPIIYRKLLGDLDIGGGYTLPKGAQLILPLYRVHRNPKYWPDPYKFDPDRFRPEEVAKRHSHVYMPFNAGPRNCIGSRYAMMSMKVLTATLLREYVLIKDKVTPIKDIRIKIDTLMKPVETITIRIEKRKGKKTS